ncbi:MULTISPECIES: molybdenum cofactor guanylyltransferase [Bacillus]|uniref:molybdenum cofactor guanylyltransferase n=1 Tax=Bacillus TaxID=1386 RepID=UPI0002E21BEA|nr:MULTISPECIES: molybdenum cofactor guanylyltransferase [Bacillus]
MECTAIILAGGKSSRMGKNKALLTVFDQTNIENIVKKCQEVASEVLIVTNESSQYEFLNVPLVKDRYKDCGPLAGLEAGLQAAKYDKCMLIACDMPFIQPNIMETLIRSFEDFDAVVPNIEGKLHPLFAAYRKSCIQPIEKRLHDRKHKMRELFNDIQVKFMTEEELSLNFKDANYAFFNMNRPEEYEEAKNMKAILEQKDKK